MNQYMRVDPTMESFGYKRIGYIIGFRGEAIGSFIDEKGYPDYLYEYRTEGRQGFIFYYLKEGKAYDFREQSWRPTSAVLIEIREFTLFEKQRFGISGQKTEQADVLNRAPGTVRPNKSLQPTQMEQQCHCTAQRMLVGIVSSAYAGHAVDPAWLGFCR